MEPISAADALDTLIRDYGKLVFHVIYGLTNHWEDSQDLTQDTFMQALQGIDAARAISGAHFHAKAWLMKVAVNTVRMRERRRRLFHFVPFSSLTQEASGNQETESWIASAAPVQPAGYGIQEGGNPADIIAERDVVARALANLPDLLRLPLLLSIVAGCSNVEIAQVLDLREATVRQRLSRARKAFQALYAAESDEIVAIGEQRTATPERAVPARLAARAERRRTAFYPAMA